MRTCGVQLGSDLVTVVPLLDTMTIYGEEFGLTATPHGFTITHVATGMKLDMAPKPTITVQYLTHLWKEDAESYVHAKGEEKLQSAIAKVKSEAKP